MLTADDKDARAPGGGQRLKIPISVLPDDGETIIVQQRFKFLRESVTQCDARDFGLLLVGFDPAPVSPSGAGFGQEGHSSASSIHARHARCYRCSSARFSLGNVPRSKKCPRRCRFVTAAQLLPQCGSQAGPMRVARRRQTDLCRPGAHAHAPIELLGRRLSETVGMHYRSKRSAGTARPARTCARRPDPAHGQPPDCCAPESSIAGTMSKPVTAKPSVRWGC